jgi:Kelch motif
MNPMPGSPRSPKIERSQMSEANRRRALTSPPSSDEAGVASRSLSASTSRNDTICVGCGESVLSAAARWETLRDSTLARTEVAAARIGDSAHVVGGYTAANGLAAETSALWRYDPGVDRWTRLPDAPTPRAALKTHEIYDFAARRWTVGLPMTIAREHLAGAARGGAFYALAGRAAGRGNFKVVERYVVARGRWERVPSMRKRRGGIAAAVVSGRIVVV